MLDVLPPAVAGLFYERDARLLAQKVDGYLDAVAPTSTTRRPKALIVPHAGHIYSGPIAASAYARLAPFASSIRRVVLLGPSHRVHLGGLALPGARALSTPLGDVALDPNIEEQLKAFASVVTFPQAHLKEHSLEVQLPFLQRLLKDFTLVPLVVGDADPTTVGEVLEGLWGGAETLIVISTDLSHFQTYDEAKVSDRDTADRILKKSLRIFGEDACGFHPLTGMLWVAERRGMTIELCDLRSSGDTAGDKVRVVGYGSFLLYEAAS